MSQTRPDQRPVVILAEEDAVQRMDVTDHLDQAGFKVFAAADADEALAMLQARPDVQAFVTDAHLPGQIDGFKLARVARERWPGMAVVLVSGHSDASSGPVPDGAEFVSKPNLLEDLAPTLRRQIGSRT